MNKKLAQDLLFVFDTPKNIETFQKYLDYELQKAYSRLKGVSDLVEVYRLQGQIASFEHLKRVRDNAVVVVRESNHEEST